MVQITFNGGIGCTGGNRILVENGEVRVIMDYGAKVSDRPEIAHYDVDGKIDYAFLTHAHRDHSEDMCQLVKSKQLQELYGIEVTKGLSELLMQYSLKIGMKEGKVLKFDEKDVEKTMETFRSSVYRSPIMLSGGVEAELFDAGHIPGSAMIGMKIDGKQILYTGDFNTQDTRLLKGCDKNLPIPDILITESTYTDRNHPDRESQEKELADIIKRTYDNGGATVIAGFGIGRLDEIIALLYDYVIINN